MKKIDKGIVFSYDIKRILNGINAFDYQYEFVPRDSTIETLRTDFQSEVNKIFQNRVTIISEEEMMRVNDFIDGDCPHCYFG